MNVGDMIQQLQQFDLSEELVFKFYGQNDRANYECCVNAAISIQVEDLDEEQVKDEICALYGYGNYANYREQCKDSKERNKIEQSIKNWKPRLEFRLSGDLFDN